jgi:hypothetical protein
MEAPGEHQALSGGTVWRRDEAGRLHRLLEAEPMLVRVCQSGWLPVSVLVRSTRFDEDLALALSQFLAADRKI